MLRGKGESGDAKALARPPWLSPVHGAVVVTCVAGVATAATFQHVVVMGSPPAPRFYGVPVLVGAAFGVVLIAIRRVMAENRAFANALEERARRIEDLNRALEERVADRTRELSEKHEQLMQAQRQEMIGHLVGGVAHDLNNLLTVIRANADLIAEDGVMDPEVVQDIIDSSERAQRFARGLVATARRPRTPQALPVKDVIDDMVGLLSRAFGKSYVVSSSHVGLSPAVDASRVEQILLNLMVNARDAQPDGGRIDVRTVVDQGGESILIEVCDDGPGIPENIRERVFETFFTTKPSGEGSGLGLATVKSLVSELEGEVELATSPSGTTFRVRLPRAA